MVIIHLTSYRMAERFHRYFHRYVLQLFEQFAPISRYQTMFCWDGRSLQWIIPAVPPAEVTLPETGSSLAPPCQSSAGTETSWRWHPGALNYDVCHFVHNWNSLSADPSVEIPEHLQEKPGPSSRNLTAPVGFSKNMEMFSELLSMDLSKLSVDEGHQINESQDFVNVPPLQSLETFWCPGGSGDNRPTFSARVGIFPGPKFHLFCKNDRGPHGSVLSVLPQMPATNMADILSSQADGMLMSDVALQSHICDFCQAVFPGDTGTRGDFLRHLYTHIT